MVPLLVCVSGIATGGLAASAGASRGGAPIEVFAAVTIGGRGPFRFLVDTGSSHSSVNPGLARQLAAPRVAKTELSTATGRIWVPVVRLDDLAVDAVHVDDLLATEADVTALAGLADADGVLGLDLLARHSFMLDFRSGAFAWSATADPGDRPVASLQLETSGLVWLAVIPRSGQALRLVPDSGANALVLFDRAGQRLPIFASQPRSADVHSVAGRRSGRLGVLRDPAFRAIGLGDVPVAVLDGAPVDAAHGDGLLPLQQFSRAAFDPHGGRLALW